MLATDSSAGQVWEIAWSFKPQECKRRNLRNPRPTVWGMLVETRIIYLASMPPFRDHTNVVTYYIASGTCRNPRKRAIDCHRRAFPRNIRSISWRVKKYGACP